MADASSPRLGVESCIPRHFNEFGMDRDASQDAFRSWNGPEIATEWPSITGRTQQTTAIKRVDVTGQGGAHSD
jgi:hypothetical protein